MDRGPEGHPPRPPEIRLFVREAEQLSGTGSVGSRSWCLMGGG